MFLSYIKFIKGNSWKYFKASEIIQNKNLNNTPFFSLTTESYSCIVRHNYLIRWFIEERFYSGFIDFTVTQKIRIILFTDLLIISIIFETCYLSTLKFDGKLGQYPASKAMTVRYSGFIGNPILSDQSR